MTNSGAISTSTSHAEVLLNEETVVAYLRGRGLTFAKDPTVETLAGGVSNIVLAIKTDGWSCIVKQSLAKLAVAEEWRAPTGRVITEADALTLVAALTPSAVPEVYDRDPIRHAIVIERAPAEWADWRVLLFDGDIDRSIATDLGKILGCWHAATLNSPDLGSRMDDYNAFQLLRIDPYYLTVARRCPETAEALMQLIDDMGSRRFCLVHGDFSPKNILVAPPGSGPGRERQSWVIDFEVAHRGDPIFDVAFMSTHLLMKSVAIADRGDELDKCLVDFVASYSTAVRGIDTLRPDHRYLARHIGALLLARVHGKSPSGYLSPASELVISRLGTSLLTDPPTDIAEILDRRNECR